MKCVRKWISIAGVVPVLILQPVTMRAGGDDDPPHGRPEWGNGDEATLMKSLEPRAGEMMGDKGRLTAVTPRGEDPLGSLWKEIDRLIGTNFLRF